MSEAKFPNEARAALERLLDVAQRATGQSEVVAGFLLAWWNATECGGFDLTGLWALDQELAVDMAVVFLAVATHHHYPDTLGYGPRFEAVIRMHRDLGTSTQGGSS